MSFYYAIEKRRFDATWKKLEEEYLAAGFDAAGVQAMRDFDWELFRQRRTYENREQPLPAEVIDDTDDRSRSTLLQKFPALTIVMDDDMPMNRHGWVETIADPILADKLTKLSADDKELLTLLVFDSYTQTEIAAMQGCTQVAVCKRFKRIKSFLQVEL